MIKRAINGLLFKITSKTIKLHSKSSSLFSNSKPPINNEESLMNLSKEELETMKQIFDHQTEGLDINSIAEQIKLDQDSPIKLSEVFQNREQLLSFNLMGCQDINQIMDIYMQELQAVNLDKQKNPELTPSEFSLFIYFFSCMRSTASYHRQMQQIAKHFQHMVDKVIEGHEQVLPNQWIAVVWAVGTYVFEFEDQLILLDRQAYLLIKATQQCLEALDTEQLPALAFALSNIFRSRTDDLAKDTILQILQLAQKNISLIPPSQLLSLIHSIPNNSIVASRPIFEYVKECAEKEAISVDDLSLITKELIRIDDQQGSPVIGEVLDTMKKLIEGGAQLSISRATELMEDLVCVKNCSQFKPFLKKLQKVIHSQSDKLNITDYTSVFLSLVQLRKMDIEIDVTLEILKRLLIKSNIFTLRDFNSDEIVTLLVALAGLRVDDKNFIQQIIATIKPNLLPKEDLYRLAMSFVVYIRQFEDFYVMIHNDCALRMNQFSQEQRVKLRIVFSRVKIVIPDSPFVK